MNITQLNGRESGKRIFVCGTSPNLVNLPHSRAKGAVKIGINRFYQFGACKYWICADLAPIAWSFFGHDFNKMNSIRLMHGPSRTIDIPESAADYWFDTTRDTDAVSMAFPTPLLTGRTTAVCAVHLAVILGASEIVLWGVDLTGPDQGVSGVGTYKGSGQDPNYWDNRATIANEKIKFLAQKVPIYKTNPLSPLELPLW